MSIAKENKLYSSRSSYVLGFHGLDEAIGKKILNGNETLRHSNNDYDWLGDGVYFWEHSLERAKQYAIQDSKRPNSKIKTPFVLGAVIDLGRCLDLLDKRWLDFTKQAYEEMVQTLSEESHVLPTNSAFNDTDFDLKKRYLDCAVIRYAIQAAKADGTEFDSVRAVFWEGKPLYPGAGFNTHNHIQLSIINSDCIKGIFLPK